MQTVSDIVDENAAAAAQMAGDADRVTTMMDQIARVAHANSAAADTMRATSSEVGSTVQAVTTR
ncbi:MAG TPA: hypothetical protein PK954_08035, partial [Anaerolineales bacterium]|nr:hypothetical protein [Anaerolineales bacterium]